MNLMKARNAIRQVAKQHGMSEKEIVADIESAIGEAYARVCQKKDETALGKWKCIPCKGNIPNAYELVAYLGDVVKFLS